MAGRPKRRAKLEAEAAKAASDPWAGAPDQWAASAPVDPWVTPPESDREFLDQWWRSQVAEIERAGAERRELLATAGEHPSPIFARQAKTFGALGIPRDVVAVLLEMSQPEMEMYYGNEYAAGSAEVVSQVAANLLRIATSTNDRVAVKAAIEVMNRRGGEEWRPPAQKLEVTDDRKGRGNVVDTSNMTYDDRQLMREILLRTMGKGVSAGLIPATIESEAEGEEG
jgi:hypothetical protein